MPAASRFLTAVRPHGPAPMTQTRGAMEGVMGTKPELRLSEARDPLGRRDLGNDVLMNVGERRHHNMANPRPPGQVDVLDLAVEAGIRADRRSDAVGKIIVLQPAHVV